MVSNLFRCKYTLQSREYLKKLIINIILTPNLELWVVLHSILFLKVLTDYFRRETMLWRSHTIRSFNKTLDRCPCSLNLGSMTDGIEIQIISTSEKFVNSCHKSTVTFKHRDLGQAISLSAFPPLFASRPVKTAPNGKVIPTRTNFKQLIGKISKYKWLEPK